MAAVSETVDRARPFRFGENLMADFELKAKAQYTPRGDMGRFIATRITPGVKAGVERWTKAVYDESQILCPVRRGELKASGKMEVRVTEKSVVGTVAYTAAHAGFNEFGTGQRGAASPGVGSGPYSATWPGMPATPYIRPAMDSTRGDGKVAMVEELSIAIKS